MGLNCAAVRTLAAEAARKPFGGNLLTLGRQDVFATPEDLERIAGEFGVKTVKVDIPAEALKADFAANRYISDTYLFRSLGCEHVTSMDYSQYESAEIVFDLNRSDLPPELAERFDVIVDSGTIEHIFHIPNALNNIFKMLRTGGRIIHIAPSSNHIDHGFYMFSPTLFWDYYHANRFEVNTCQVFMYTLDIVNGPWEITPYEPGILYRLSIGGLDDNIYGIILVATKTELSTGDEIPQQGVYANVLWNNREKQEPPPERPAPAISFAALARSALFRTPLLGEIARRLFSRPTVKSTGLKVTARY